jgi:hypothetical protein
MRRSNTRHKDDSGFTLIELIIVCAVLPMVIGAISVAMVSVFSLQGGVSNRLSDSADAQIVSANFEKDVQSAAKLTTDTTSSPQCGPGTQLLGLELNFNQQTGIYQTVVSYVEVQNGSIYSLVRQYCGSGAAAIATSTSTVSGDLPAGQAHPVVTPSASNIAAAAGWTSAQNVTGVTIAITEPKSNYSYTLVALPGSSSSSSPLSSASSPSTSCGFATAGTGSYASTLCFVDFSNYSSNAVCPSAAVPNTPFTMSFCINVTGGPVAPAGLPTYPGAFLGNTTCNQAGNPNPCPQPNTSFYTGIPGKPALYQTTEGTTSYVNISDIQVVNSSGSLATGWQLIAGDAETTDAGESITWTSDKDLSLLPNSSTSPIGNACAYSPAPSGTYYAGTWLTGIGTTQVECAASVSSNKTGTVMLEAPAPTTLNITMVGTGLEAIFVGLLLPGSG